MEKNKEQKPKTESFSLGDFLKDHKVVVFNFNEKAFKEMGIDMVTDVKEARAEVRKTLGITSTRAVGINKQLNNATKELTAEQKQKVLDYTNKIKG